MAILGILYKSANFNPLSVIPLLRIEYLRLTFSEYWHSVLARKTLVVKIVLKRVNKDETEMSISDLKLLKQAYSI